MRAIELIMWFERTEMLSHEIREVFCQLALSVACMTVCFRYWFVVLSTRKINASK